jgi:hypothetical protein
VEKFQEKVHLLEELEVDHHNHKEVAMEAPLGLEKDKEKVQLLIIMELLYQAQVAEQDKLMLMVMELLLLEVQVRVQDKLMPQEELLLVDPEVEMLNQVEMLPVPETVRVQDQQAMEVILLLLAVLVLAQDKPKVKEAKLMDKAQERAQLHPQVE